MDIEYYRNFIAIVEAGSISAAAKRINIAQPALSNQLKVLQSRFDAKLLDVRRGGHSIELTDAGCILYNKAKYICSIESAALKEIADCSAGFHGTLRISLSPSMSISFIKSSLSDFCRAYPHINYELYEVPVDEQVEQLLSGKTEIGIANAPLKQAFRFETVFNRREHLVALFHKDSPFLDTYKGNILLEEIPVCLSRGCSELFLSVCSDSRIFPQILSVNTTKLATVAWAEKNLGVAVVPASPEETFPDCLVCRDIRDERLVLERSMLIVKNRQLSNVAKTFLSFYMQRI